MARIDGSVGQKSDAYEFYIIWTESDVNISNNTSKVTATSYIYCNKHTAYNYNTYDHTITIDGQEFTTSVAGISLSAGVTKELASASKVITHDSDGSKSITISASSPTLPYGNGYGPASGSASGTATLTKIARTSSVGCSDAYIGSNATITIGKADDSLTHTLKYAFGSLSGTIVSKTTLYSYPWPIPSSFYTQIPNAMSGVGTITCETYSGSTLVGTSTCGFKALVYENDNIPTLTGSVIDTNSTTVALTGSNAKLVKYYSTAQVTINATAKNSATITTRSVTAGNKSGSGTTVTLSNIETGTFNLSCKDSRGIPNSKTVTNTLINYVKLAFTSVVIDRESSLSNTVKATIKGNYFNGSFGSVSNTLTLKFKSRLSGGTWGSETTLTATISGNTFTCSATLGTAFLYTNSYEFQFIAVDKLATVTNNKTLTTGQPIIDIGENDVKINGEVAVTDYLTVNRKILPAGDDTREYWNGLKNGVYFNNNTSAVPNLPSSYGYLEKIGVIGSGDFNITYYTQMSGTVYRKSGNHEDVSDWVPINSNILATKENVNGIWDRIQGYGEVAKSIDTQNLNTACGVKTGNYMGSNMTNAPDTSWYYIQHFAHNSIYMSQIAHTLSQGTPNMYIRQKVNDVWGDWWKMLTRLVIYNNASGTTGTVTLNSSAAKFQYMEIYYLNGDQERSIKISYPDGKITMLSDWLYEDSSTYLFTRVNKITISGTSITRNLTRGCAVNGSDQTFTNEWSTFSIIRVVGYRG